jgi:predicted DNA-binding mobile mystery protein A
MSSELNHLRLEQIQATVSAFDVLLTKRPPRRGWLKEIREALGRTQRQQAELLGIASSTLHKSEQSEADERISLGQLRKLADALDCELVYALIPRKPLPEVVQDLAIQLAKAEVYGVAHTMSLEDQRPADERIQKQVTRRAQELLRGKWSNLWR